MRKLDQEIGKKILLTQLGSRKRGSPRLRWGDEMDEDARIITINETNDN